MVATGRKDTDRQLRVLVLSAGQVDRPLDLDQELRAIRSALADRAEIRYLPAARAEEIVHDLREFRPHIVHFMGHGSLEGLELAYGSDGYRAAGGDGLRGLLADRGVELVVLSSCYSAPQAHQIADSVAAVVGTPGVLEDEASSLFARAFYQSLRNGETAGAALRDGRDAVRLQHPGDEFRLSGDEAWELPAGDEQTAEAARVSGSLGLRRLALPAVVFAASLGVVGWFALSGWADDSDIATSPDAPSVADDLGLGDYPGDPDAEVEAFIARLTATDPRLMLAEGKERLSEVGPYPHIYEMIGIAELELGFLNEASDSFAKASPDRRSAECYGAFVSLQSDGTTAQVRETLGDLHVPVKTTELVCFEARVNLGLLSAEPSENLVKATAEALEVYPDRVGLVQLAALLAVERGDVAEADRLAVKARFLAPGSSAASLTSSLVELLASPPTDSEGWQELEAEIAEALDLVTEGTRAHGELISMYARVLYLNPFEPDVDQARSILRAIYRDSLIPLQRYRAAMLLTEMETLINTGAVVGTPGPSAELRAIGVELLEAGFAVTMTAGGYAALAVAGFLDGRFIDAYEFTARSIRTEAARRDSDGASSETTGLPAALSFNSYDVCGAQVEPCVEVPADEALAQYAMWGSESRGDTFFVVDGNGSVLGWQTGSPWMLGGEFDGEVIRGRWCHVDVEQRYIMNNGPFEFSFRRVGGRLELDGRWLSESDVGATEWREDWDLQAEGVAGVEGVGDLTASVPDGFDRCEGSIPGLTFAGALPPGFSDEEPDGPSTGD